MTGDESLEAQFAESVKAQTVDDFEIVCISEPGADSPGEELDGLAACTVTAGGTAGDRRMAGLERCNGEFVLFADTEERFSPAMLQVFSAHAEKNPEMEMAIFHTQLYDRMEKRYLTRHIAPRKLPAPEPFNPVFHADKVYQRFGASPLNRLYKRAFLTERGDAFSGMTAHGDDPGVVAHMAQASSVISCLLPLAIARIDPAGEARALGSMRLRDEMEGLVRAVRRFDVDGQSRAFLPSALEWLVDRCVATLGLLSREEAILYMDDMRELALPAVRELADKDMNPSRWRSLDAFELACLDRVALYEKGVALSDELKECGYERARLELMADRLRKSIPKDDGEKPKRRGLFRR